MPTPVTQDPVALAREAVSKPFGASLPPEVRAMIERAVTTQGITTTTGLVAYDLEPVAKNLFPNLTPLRSRMPRVKGKGGTATHWKAITAVNVLPNSPGVSEGNRNAFIKVTEKDYTAAYKTLGQDHYVTQEAIEAAEGFDNAVGAASWQLLNAMTNGEERTILMGNSSIAFGTAATPTLVDNTDDGGTIPQTTTVKVYVVALTGEGYRWSPAAVEMVTYYTAVTGDVLTLRNQRTNADGSTDFNTGYNGKISAVASVTTATDGNDEHTVSASIDPQAGALAYAWFWGPSVGADSLLGAITSVANVKITTEVGAGTTAANDAGVGTDYSQDSLVFDGLTSIIAGAGPEDGASASGAYLNALDNGTIGVGTFLTGDGAGGVAQFEAAFKHFFARYRMTPDMIVCNGQQQIDLTKLTLSTTAPIWRLQIDATNLANLTKGLMGGGVVVGSYLSKFGGSTEAGGATTGKVIPILVHPDLPPGTILFLTFSLPYPLPNVTNLLQVKVRSVDYYTIVYPKTSRKDTMGTYVSETLQSYAPFSLGAIYNIASEN